LPQTIQVWADTIEQLLLDEPRRTRLGEQAYQRALDFSHANTFRRWQQLIDQVLAS